MSETGWREFRLHVGMPHLRAGGLAEEPIIKQLGAFQWQAAAGLAGQPEDAVMSETGERLHVSMISVELGMPASRTWDEFDEGADLSFRQRARVYGRKLVEGCFVFDKGTIPDDELEAVHGRDDLAAGSRPWAYVTHGFITRQPSTWAKLETPKAYVDQPLPEASAMPAGIAEHQAVERSASIEGFPDWSVGLALPCAGPATTFVYEIEPDSDLNALGLVYCARLPGIMAGAERRLLRERLPVPLSDPLLACLRVAHRRMYYFANASHETRLRLHVEGRFVPPVAAAPTRVRLLGRLLFRSDVYRASDGVLMASSLVERVLRVPGQSKPLFTEAERWRAGLLARG